MPARVVAAMLAAAVLTGCNQTAAPRREEVLVYLDRFMACPEPGEVRELEVRDVRIGEPLHASAEGRSGAWVEYPVRVKFGLARTRPGSVPRVDEADAQLLFVRDEATGWRVSVQALALEHYSGS